MSAFLSFHALLGLLGILFLVLGRLIPHGGGT